MRERKLPKDIEGNEITFKQEMKAKRSYKPDNKPWCFPFKEAFEKIKKK